MSQEIEIVGESSFTFFGHGITKEDIPEEGPEEYYQHRCNFCTYHIHRFYVYLIDELKKTGLIKQNYPYMCCSCFVTYKDLGFVRCKECGHLLEAFLQRRENKIFLKKIYQCGVCGKKYEPKD